MYKKFVQNLIKDRNLREVVKNKDGYFVPYGIFIIQTVSAIRNYINNSANNGFDKVYFKKGKKNFIDENKFFEWFKGGNNG